MKKTVLLIVATVFFLTLPIVCIAKTEAMMGEKEKMTKERTWIKECDLGLHYIFSKQIVALPDGGALVSIGDMLYKYDANLTLTKQAQIPINIEGMKKMMKDMRGEEMKEEKTEKSKEVMPAVGTEKEKEAK